ncbi:MAG: hypothetical protein AB7O66_17705 [Limisphaerales bacterium]
MNTREPREVLPVCAQAWKTVAGETDADWIETTFGWVDEAFAGRHPGFEALDTKYHDLEHTLQGTLCLARLLQSWFESEDSDPRPDERAVRLGLVAILFHDTGYLKIRGDTAGTGAKFTTIHVQRSADFARRILGAQGYSPADILEIQSMIRCTGVNADVHALSFERPIDRRVGCALATADLLGQMAASDYIEKLPLLFDEFAEAARHGPGSPAIQSFANAADLVRHTPDFWHRHVRGRLETEFEGVYRYLNDPWPDGPNEYIARIEANLARIPSEPHPPPRTA